MATKFCADCGTSHDCTAAAEGEVAGRIRIAEIEANRDIAIARYASRTAETLGELEAEGGADHAEGVIDGMETVLEVIGGQGETDAGEPIVIDAGELGADGEMEAEAEAELGEPDTAPPVVVDVPSAPSKGGYWDMYR